MKSRPYLNHSLSQLDDLVRRRWDDPGTLLQVHAELRFHGSPAAAGLRAEIDGRIADLAEGGMRLHYAPVGMRTQERETARMAAEIDDLRRKLLETRRRLKLAEDSVRHFRERASGRDRAEALHAAMGLTPDCPAHVFEAARRAHLKAAHPDLHPPAGRRAAEAEFKRLHAAFEALAALRAAQSGS
jgi:hypothetical protein